jgi:hypothetical protein
VNCADAAGRASWSAMRDAEVIGPELRLLAAVQRTIAQLSEQLLDE